METSARRHGHVSSRAAIGLSTLRQSTADRICPTLTEHKVGAAEFSIALSTLRNRHAKTTVPIQ